MGSIISFSHIKKNIITKDGKAVINTTASSLDDFFIQSYEKLGINYPKFYKMDRLSKAGLLASELILSDFDKSMSKSTAVILSNSGSSLDTDIKYWDSTKTAASPSLFVYTLPNIVGGEICIRNGFKGESNFFITPKFDPDWLNNYVNLVLESEVIETCVAGWVEVIDDDADVFLYLTAKTGEGICDHTAENIRELYHGRISSES